MINMFLYFCAVNIQVPGEIPRILVTHPRFSGIITEIQEVMNPAKLVSGILLTLYFEFQKNNCQNMF